MKQSSGEIGCSLSHLRAAEMALEIDASLRFGHGGRYSSTSRFMKGAQLGVL